MLSSVHSYLRKYPTQTLKGNLKHYRLEEYFDGFSLVVLV